MLDLLECGMTSNVSSRDGSCVWHATDSCYNENGQRDFVGEGALENFRARSEGRHGGSILTSAAG